MSPSRRVRTSWWGNHTASHSERSEESRSREHETLRYAQSDKGTEQLRGENYEG